MDRKFEVIFLEDAIDFLENLDEKSREKILFNIDKSSYLNDPKLFKKLTNLIWEFRILYNKKQYRLLAFWDKEKEDKTLVISTHGFVKKTSRIPKKELKKAENLRIEYFENKK